MLFNTLVLAALSGISLVSAVPVEERSTPPLDQVSLVSVAYGGSGCPQKSVGQAISDDKQLITLFFDKYIAESGPGVSPAKNRAACQLNMKLHFPQGWQFGVFKADYRGYVGLPANTKGYCKATYYFSGDHSQVDREVWFQGPRYEDYIKEDTIGIDTTVWSPCGAEGMLNIKSSIGIVPIGTPQPALLTVDSADLKYKQYYHLQWRRCKN